MKYLFHYVDFDSGKFVLRSKEVSCKKLSCMNKTELKNLIQDLCGYASLPLGEDDLMFDVDKKSLLFIAETLFSKGKLNYAKNNLTLKHSLSELNSDKGNIDFLIDRSYFVSDAFQSCNTFFSHHTLDQLVCFSFTYSFLILHFDYYSSWRKD